MAAMRKDDEGSISRTLHLERRQWERVGTTAPSGMDQRTPEEEIERMKQLLAFSARTLADLRSRNEQLMAVNSDLRCKLGEMTLRWVDLCNRSGV